MEFVNTPEGERDLAEKSVNRQGAGGAQANHRVLIVDDDLDFADALGTSLEMHGYEIAVAGDADEALEVADRYEPQVSLLDLKLSQSDGLELLPALHERFPDMMCLILTAYADLESAIGAVRYRADDYLRKPLPPEEVAAALDRCFERRELAQTQQSQTEMPDPDQSGEAAEPGFERPPRKGPLIERENVFGRLMVKRFAHLFVKKGGRSLIGGDISRRILPGFFVALSMMLGAERLEEYQNRCRRIVSRLLETHPDGMLWDAFFTDEEVETLALDAEVGMALHFVDPERRIVWFVNLVNRELDSGSAGAAGIRFSQENCRLLLRALFSDVTDALSREDGRQAIAERYGAEKCDLIAKISLQIERAAGAS